MKKIFFIIILSLLLLILNGCYKSEHKEISKYWWKYGSGYHLSDILILNESNLMGDTIFSNGRPEATIVYFGKPFYRNDYTLKIKSLKTGDTGNYHEKGLNDNYNQK